MAMVHDYATGATLRGATKEELKRSLDAAQADGERGVFKDPVSGASVYVTGELSEFDVELATRADFADLNQGHWGLPNKWRGECKETFTDAGGMGDCPSVSYGCFEGSPNNPRAYYVQEDSCKWWMADYAGGSDYSGGSVCESNYRVLVRECERIDSERGRKDDEPTFWQCFYGGHGTYAIAFHVDKTPKEVFEMLAALENYPVLDEQDWSELEYEQENEAWKNWAANDYRRALEKEFNGDAGEVSDSNLLQHFLDWSDKAGEYWEHSSEGPYIRLERIVDACTEPPEGFIRETKEQESDL